MEMGTLKRRVCITIWSLLGHGFRASNSFHVKSASRETYLGFIGTLHLPCWNLTWRAADYHHHPPLVVAVADG